ncbi:hypothetical protein IBX73_04545 [candidate division WOR-3 bacterium]|nr:hypothetical protein [candidate division WOR-3 bacterium]
MVQKERIRPLNRRPVVDKKYVLYWMQQSQRTEYNHALEYAIERANELNKPGKNAYLEELLVRRALSMNYVCYNEHYASFEGPPGCRAAVKVKIRAGFAWRTR